MAGGVMMLDYCLMLNWMGELMHLICRTTHLSPELGMISECRKWTKKAYFLTNGVSVCETKFNDTYVNMKITSISIFFEF